MRNYIARLLTALPVIIASLSGVHAHATVLVPTDLNELARDATIIARGEVVSVDARWTEGRRSIETIVTMETESYMKGQLGRTLQFSVPGGTVGRLRNLVLGAPRFERGQHIIVFLGASGPQVPHILGLNQGVYRVDASASGEAVVMPPPVMPGVAGRVVRGAASRTPAPLASFEARIRQLAGGAR